MAGLRLLLKFPRRATRSCDDCEKYLWEDEEIVRRPVKVGLPVLRPPGSSLPCAVGDRSLGTDRCPKIPLDAPAVSRRYAVGLSDQHKEALDYYHECRAIGDNFGDDPDWLVRRNAKIIRAMFDQAEQLSAVKLLAAFGGNRE